MGHPSHIGLSRTHIVHNLGMIGSMQCTSHAIATWRYFCPFLCLISNTSLGVTSLLCISHPHVSVDTLTATDRDCILFRSCWSIISLSMLRIDIDRLCLQLLSSHRWDIDGPRRFRHAFNWLFSARARIIMLLRDRTRRILTRLPYRTFFNPMRHLYSCRSYMYMHLDMIMYAYHVCVR